MPWADVKDEGILGVVSAHSETVGTKDMMVLTDVREGCCGWGTAGEGVTSPVLATQFIASE